MYRCESFETNETRDQGNCLGDDKEEGKREFDTWKFETSLPVVILAVESGRRYIY